MAMYMLIPGRGRVKMGEEVVWLFWRLARGVEKGKGGGALECDIVGGFMAYETINMADIGNVR